MSIDARESSPHDGAPQRLFLFSMGDRRFGYVNSPRAHTYAGVQYIPTAVDMDDVSQALSEDSPVVRVEIDSQSELAAMFIPYMPVLPVSLRTYRFHTGLAEYATELVGEVASASHNAETDMCELSVRLLSSRLDRSIPWQVYQKQCNHALYGPGCRVNRELYKVETELASHSGATIYSPAFETEDPSYFVAGYVVRVATGDVRWVVAQNGGDLTLQTAFPDLAPGEAIVAFAGCDLLKTTCETKFNNLDRRWGFDDIPSKNPFTDNVFGTGSPSGTGGSNKGEKSAGRLNNQVS